MTDDIVDILAQAIRDPKFATMLAESPKVAAESIEKVLSEEETKLLDTVSLSQVSDIADLWAALGYPKTDNSKRQFEDFVNLFEKIKGVRLMLENLMALLDQQQQQKGRRFLENMVALLDQQQ